MKKRGVFGLGLASGIVAVVLAIKVIPILVIAGSIGLAVSSCLPKGVKQS